VEEGDRITYEDKIITMGMGQAPEPSVHVTIHQMPNGRRRLTIHAPELYDWCGESKAKVLLTRRPVKVCQKWLKRK
jgi:hypothetical protein